MRKIISRVLVFVLLWNLVQPGGQAVYGAAVDDFVFDWNQAYIMNDVLSTTINRGQAQKDQILLNWDFEKIKGSTYRDGIFELEYHLENGKKVVFTVNKNIDTSTVSYKVLSTATGIEIWDASKYRIYDSRNQRWVTPTESRFETATDVFAYNTESGANFQVIPGTGFSFQVDGRLLRFKWDQVQDPNNPLTQKDMFYFMTDGADIGKVYPFQLKFTRGGNEIASKALNILTGVSNFYASPLSSGEVKELVDQVKSSPDPRPGHEPGVRLNFDMPYSWNGSNTFVQDASALDQTTVRLNMEKIQLIIPNITNLSNITRSDGNAVTIELKTSSTTGRQYYEIDLLGGLEASKIYDPTNIIFDRGSSFKTERTELQLGRVYTYLEYFVERTGPDQLYLRITPYQGLKGIYTSFIGVSKDDTYNNINKWVEYEDKTGTGEPIYIPIYLNENHVNYYRIQFMLTDGNTPVSSQVLYYKTDGEEEYLGAPEKVKAIETRVVPGSNAQDEPEAVQMTLQWEIGKDSVFKQLLGYDDIVFRLYKSLQPYTGYDPEAFTTISARLVDGQVVIDGPKVLAHQYSTEKRTIGGKVTDVGIITTKLDVKGEVPIPSIYFFKMDAVYRDAGAGRTTDESIPIHVTFDYKGAVIPQPQNLRIPAESVQNHGFQVEWSTMTPQVYRQYEEYVLRPTGFQVESVEYRIFFTQNRALLEQKQSGLPNIMVNTGELDLTAQLEALRNGEVIAVTVQSTGQDALKEIQSLRIQGLDRNQVYYVGLQTVLHVQKNGDTPEARVSDLSEIVTTTTKNEIENPEPEDMIPAAPDNFTKDAIAANSVKLLWTKSADPVNTGTSGQQERIEYELIRVRNTEMQNLNNREPIQAVISQLGTTNIAAWRTNGSGLMIYSNGIFVANTNSGYIYNNQAVPLSLTDTTLSPNQLYYYYVRTVRMVDGEVKARSSWKGLSVTTKPIEKPMYLQIERGYSFNKKTETFISFDVLVPKNGKTPEQMLHDNEYEFRIAIKEDGGEEYIETVDSAQYNARFWEEKGTNNAYRKFVYKIEGLRPGKSYSFKVRVIDRALGASSLYSNVATTRTDMDQQDYDTQQGLEKWMKIFDQELQKLKNSTFWTLQDSSTTYEALYRTDRITQEMSSAGIYDLGNIEKSRQIYHIPAKTLIQVNAKQITLRVRRGNTEILISPNSIDPSLTQAIINIQQRIKENKLQDYYVRFVVDWDGFSQRIDGNTPVSDRIQIRISIVGTTAAEKKIEQDILAKMDAVAAQSLWKAQLQAELTQKIREGASEEKLMEAVMNKVKEVQTRYMTETRTLFEKVSEYTNSIATLESPLMILVGGQTGSIRGYRNVSGVWRSVEVLPFGNQRGLETKELGVYIFTSNTTQAPNLNGLQNSGQIQDIIGRYNLDDFFGKDTAWNLSGSATRYMVVGSVARIAGAPRGQEPVAWLQGKGFTEISARNVHDPITNQEAAYLMMKLYEIKTNTKMNTIRITNYNIIQNLESVAEPYRQSVLTAAQLGILQGGDIQPTGRLNIKQVLEMLGALGSKISL